MNPTFDYEQKHWKKGARFVAGADEVGRGAFAGPVVASAVAFAPTINIEVLIRDSKKMKPRQRELASEWIKTNCLGWGVGEASVIEINKLGIVRATNKAFRRSITKCSIHIEKLLVDAFYIPYIAGIKKKNQTPIVKGDGLSISIAAASIIAKVYRDRLMDTLGEEYKHYKWGKNKGYGTLEHRTAIKRYGITPEHRRAFVKPFVFQG
jgi:ribonuclease HII